jgi:hypothetical protein
MAELRWKPGDPTNLKPEAKELLDKFRPPMLLHTKLFIAASIMAGSLGLLLSLLEGSGNWLARAGGVIIVVGVLSASKDIQDYMEEKIQVTPEPFSRAVGSAAGWMAKSGKSDAEIEAFRRDFRPEHLQQYVDVLQPALVKKWIKQQRRIDTWIVISGTLINSLATVFG